MDRSSSAARRPQQCIGPADKRTQSAASVGTPPGGLLFRSARPVRSTLGDVAQLSRQRLGVLLLLAVAGAGVVVAVALSSSDEPVRAAAASTSAAAPLSGLPLVALPPVADAKTDDRLASLEALATQDPSRADVQMAIGSEQLVRGDAVAATAAFNAAKKLGEPAADTALVVAGYNAEVARCDHLAPRAARAVVAVRPLRAGRRAAVGRPAAAGDRGAAGRPRRRAGVVLRRQGRRPAASRPCSPATRCSCPPTPARGRDARVAEGGRRKAPNDAKAQLQYGSRAAGRRAAAGGGAGLHAGAEGRSDQHRVAGRARAGRLSRRTIRPRRSAPSGRSCATTRTIRRRDSTSR